MTEGTVDDALENDLLGAGETTDVHIWRRTNNGVEIPRIVEMGEIIQISSVESNANKSDGIFARNCSILK